MQKNLYFTSPNQPHFIEINNNLSEKREYRIYFQGETLNLFLLEGISIVNYDSFENGYVLTIDSKQSRYLEIYPKCGDVSIDSFVNCIIETKERDFLDINKLNLSLRKERFGKNVPLYSTFDKKFKQFEKEEYETYALQNINPRLSGNVKLRIDSNDKLYFTLFDEISETNNDLLYNRTVKNGSDYLNELTKFFKDLDRKTETFYQDVIQEKYNSKDGSSLKSQLKDDVYAAGASNFPSTAYKEKFSIFAPLYLENKIPSKFIIFRRDKVNNLKTSELFKDLTIIKSFDLTKNTELGQFIDRTKSRINFEKSHIKSQINKNSVILEITGFDPEASSISTIFEDATDYISKESRIIDFETFITDTYKRRKLVSHRILNLEFLFDDDIPENEMKSYFGMYVDELDLDQYELDLEYYGYDIYNKCNAGIKRKETSIKVIKDIPDISKYINTNDRIFYIKDSVNNFYDLESISEKTFNLKNSVDICNFSKNIDSHLVIDKDKIIKNVNPYINVKFNTDIYDNTQLVFIQNSKRYEVTFVDELLNSNIFSHPKIENVYPVTLLNNNTIQIEDYQYIPDSQTINLINPSSEISVESSYSSTNGNSTQISFSDSIDLNSITHVKIDQPEKKTIEVKIGINLEETLGKLVETIKSLDEFPFTVVQENSEIFIFSNNFLMFDLFIDTTNSLTNLNKIQRFDQDLNISNSTVDGKTYKSNTITISSINISSNNLYEIDPYFSEYFNKGDYFYDGNSSIIKSNPIDGPNFTVKYIGNSTVIKIPSKDNIKKIYKPGNLTLGLFSFYDIRRFDTQKMSNNFNFIKSEYQKIYKRFLPEEKLIPRMIYEVRNLGNFPITISVRYGKEDYWNHKELIKLSIASNSSRKFSTFLSDYDLTSYNENIEFRYFLEDGSYESVSVYNTNIFEDPDLYEFDPEFPNTPYDTIKLQNEIDIQKDKENPEFIYYQDSRNEYFRLSEFSNIDTTIEDIVIDKYLKWTDYKFKDSKSQPHRLNFSPSLGHTGYLSTFSNHSSRPELHPHEWFLMEEFPTHLPLYEGVESLYLFSRVSKDLLLDINYDYFTEYFSTGHLGISEISGKDVKLSRRDNYSILKRMSFNEYEVTFKGVKYRFNSETDLSNYKFSIIHSTRPDLESNVHSIVDHCEVIDIGPECKDLGILPKLKNAIDNLVLGDQTINIVVSIINSGTSISIPELNGVTEINSGTLFTMGDFGTELLYALSKWKNTLERIYNKDNGYSGNLTVSFSTKIESGNYPVGEFYITDDQKITSKIGDIRIGMSNILDTDIAKTLYISQESYKSTSEVITPSIIINNNAILRKNSDVSPDAFSLSYIMAHELGHAFGLGHVSIEGSLMNPIIKLNYNLEEIENEDKCIISIYGEPLISYSNNIDFNCNLSRYRINDKFEFIVNEKFKSITLKIYVDIPNYINLDSKKSFIDLYLSNSLKRVTSYDNVYTLEGIDLKIPNIDLSVKNIKSDNDTIYSFSNQFLNLYSNGNNSEYSAYRIRDIQNNSNDFTIDYLSLTYSPVVYNLKKSFNKSGEYNKSLLTRISNGYDSSLDIKIPLLNSEYFTNSYFYRIKGGDSIHNANYKLTLDYLSSIVDIIPIEGSNIKFNVEILPLKKINLETIKIPVLVNDKENSYFKLEEGRVETSIFRTEGNYDPMTDKLSYFSLREDYNLSTLFRIDFYKLNTKFLWNYNNFSKYNDLIRKIGPSNQLIENRLENRFSLFQQNQKFDNKEFNLYFSGLDDNLYQYYSDNSKKILSGFYDPTLIKNYFNSQLINTSNKFEVNVLIENITYEQIKTELVIKLDINSTLLTELTNKIINYYKKIYNLNDIPIEDSLKRLIYNNIIKLYKVDYINIYSMDSIEIEYNSDVTGMILDSNFTITDSTTNIKEIKRPLDNGKKIKFNIKIGYKYI